MLQLPIKKYLIIGSYALGIRPSKDIDVICYQADVECEYVHKDDYCGHFTHNGVSVELLFADKQPSFQLFLQTVRNGGSMKAYYSILLAIKGGHIIYPSRDWDKHIQDYHALKAMASDSLMIENKYYSISDLTKLHRQSTEQRLGAQRLPKLKNTTKEQFFDDAVVKYYVHDDIHQWFAHQEKPMYSYMQPDPQLVHCDKDMWKRFSRTQQLQCVMEECYVIASERHLIPALVKGEQTIHPTAAFRWALMRVCTTLCSGWFRNFAIDHYYEILNNHNRLYIDILKQNM